MADIELPFATQEGRSSAPQNSQERLFNMYVEVETDGRRRVIRKQRAATTFYTEALGTSRRAIEKFDDTNYALFDDALYTIGDYNVSPSVFATIPAAGAGRTNRCTMIFDDNGGVLISDGIAAYTCTSAGGAMSVAATQSAVGYVTFLNGYGIYNQPGTAKFWVSALNNFTTWDALDFATAETYSDDLVRPFADHNELLLFGKTSTEVWGVSGATDFPFSPLTNAHMERGCAAALSIAKGDNTVFWLGNDLIVYKMDGFRPVRISTHSIERLIADVPSDGRSEAEAFVYTKTGHKFYTLRFPGYLTIQYNMSTGLWNEAGTFGENDWQIVGPNGTDEADYVLTPINVCTLDDTANEDDESTPMLRKAISAPIWADDKRVSLRSYFLDVEVGRAPITTTDPQIMLRYAPDGETFGNIRSRSVGNTGEYQKRIIWRNLGFGRRGTVEISATDDFPLKIVGADGNISVASS